MSDKPVIVYGASGYTGRLICEYLREYNVPFVAAGRDAGKVTSSMSTNVAGIETAQYDVVETDHDVASLTELFKGASVVCNTVGPFRRYGPEVVEACLAAGVHYLDTTGEQDWLITCDEQYGADFASAGLLLAPGVAQMYTTGEIAAQLCLEKPGLDTLDIAVFWGGSPTIASTQTILVNAALAGAHYLEQNTYQPWDPEAGLYSLSIPGQHELALALPWGGTSHPVWFRKDPRVANVKALGGVFNKALMQGVPADRRGRHRGDQGHERRGPVRRPRRDRRPGDEHDAAAREPPPQQVPRLGARVGSARPRALRDPRQPELQADRADAGVRGVLPAPAAAPPGRLRLRLPGVRAPRAARRAPRLRAGLRAGADRGGVGVRLADYLDKGASLGPDRPCLTTDGVSLSYAEVLGLSGRVAGALAASGHRPGATVAVLSANDPVAFASVFGISRAGAVWCPINPRNEAAENRELLALFDCEALIFQASFAPLVAAIRADLPGVRTWVCLDGEVADALTWDGVPRSRRRSRSTCRRSTTWR